MPSLLRRSLAEALGTFALVFIGAGSVVSKSSPRPNFGLLGIALAHAVVLSVMITATMAISGGHLNPAVTIGLLVARRTDVRTGAGLHRGAARWARSSRRCRSRCVYPLGGGPRHAARHPAMASTSSFGQAIGIEAS